MRRAWLFLLLLAPAVARASEPRAEFRENSYDFGLLIQGTTAQHSFAFRNGGNARLEVQSVNTSCGCTAALAADTIIWPGKPGRIDVSYDSRGKLGDVEKQVRVWTNDPARPMTVLIIRAKVVPSVHPEMTDARNLFQGSCAACHAAPAAGKTGEALYNAACAMCHERPPAQGPPIGPGREAMSSRSRGALAKTISEGKDAVSMPAFSNKRGGPLNKKQVKSLVDFIKSHK